MSWRDPGPTPLRTQRRATLGDKATRSALPLPPGARFPAHRLSNPMDSRTDVQYTGHMTTGQKTWEAYDHELASIATELIGAALYYEHNPQDATDAMLADAFRSYTSRLRAVERPA